MGLLNIAEMWWLIGSAPDFSGKCPGFESGISHNDSDALQDHCVIIQNISEMRGKPSPEENSFFLNLASSWFIVLYCKEENLIGRPQKKL